MAHIHDLIDFVVTPVVIHPDKDKVLMVFHPRYQKWMNIGGHIELDETPDQALLREITEECGLEVEVLSEKLDFDTKAQHILWRPRSIDVHEANHPHRHVSLVYFCLAKSADFVMSDEHIDMGWFNVQELDEMKDSLSALASYYAKLALKEVNNA